MTQSQSGIAQGENVRQNLSAYEKARQNIAKMQEAKNNISSGYFNLKAGEQKVLQFTGDIEPTETEFKRTNSDGTEQTQRKTRFSYKIMDLDAQDKGVQVWTISKRWSDMVDALLMEGFLTLKVRRIGSGKETNYSITPINPNTGN
jgi:hypothetical protein